MKVPVGKGPIAESDYWKDREIGLLMLVEQLKTPMAKRILNVLNKIKSTIASNFQFFYSDLWKTYTEARDNNRFLSTILRHFKVRDNDHKWAGRIKTFGRLVSFFLFFRYEINTRYLSFKVDLKLISALYMNRSIAFFSRYFQNCLFRFFEARFYFV